MTVLLVNPEYPETFWSLNVVLKTLGKKLLQPPLGLITIAALLPEDWDLRIVELTDREISEDEWNQCDIVMVSGMWVQAPGILRTIKEGRRRGKTVVVGGPWVFHLPEAALEAGADIVVKGEGEPAMPRLLEALERGESGIVIQAAAPANLEESPPPRIDLLDLSLYAQMDVQFSRGCPFKCEFCDITLMFGRRVRTKSPGQILRELQNIHDAGWRRFVSMVDDNFIGNPPQAKALLKEMVPWMKERGHPFEFDTQVSVNLAAYPDLLDMMVEAGFYRVFVGIETPDKESLKLTKKYQNAAVDLDAVCRTINKAGLQVAAGCIMGFDNEKPGADQRLIDFAVRNQIPEMFVMLLQVGPGTELYERLRREGRLLPIAVDEPIGTQTSMINFVPTRPTREIVEEFIRVFDVLYQPEAFLERAYNQFERLGRPPARKRFAFFTRRERWALTVMLCKQGFVYPSRWKFWKLLFKGLVKFPCRIRQFATCCVLAEHYFQHRETIKTTLRAKLSKHKDVSQPLPPVEKRRAQRLTPGA
jgi:radical SAM superfamily enzyme YgiQ (UPF0313 family)